MDFSASSSSKTKPEEQQYHQLLPPQPSTVEIPHQPGNRNHVEQRIPSSCSLPPPDCPTDSLQIGTEHEKVVLLDHCYDNRDIDDNYLPENINYASLISRIRGIRGGSQIQYRVARKRGPGNSKKRKLVDDMEVDDMEMDGMDVDELSSEVAVADKHKRVKRQHTRSRDSPYDKNQRKSAKKSRSGDRKKTSPINPTEAPDLPEMVT